MPIVLPRNGWVQPVEGVPGGIPIPIDPAEGEPNFVTGQTAVAVAGTAQQLNGGVSIPIPNGMQLVIKAPKDATGAVTATSGPIYVSNSKANAENHSVAYPLAKQEFIAYAITDVNLVWVDAAVSGNGVVWTVEKAT